MRIPRRLKRQRGRHALVDGIPFALPVNSERTPALMAAFTIDAGRAATLLPGDELHPLRVSRSRGVLVVAVVNYQITDIGSYIEFSLGIACTHGPRRAPPLLPAVFHRPYGTGQFVYDLPVSTEISVKGGKGIWGMPKHQAYLEFESEGPVASSRYFLDGHPAVELEVRKPGFARFPLAASGANYSAFRGMLMKSYVHFRGRAGFSLPFARGAARLTIGDQPRVAPLKELDVGERPLFAGWFPATRGILDDHAESWFLSYERPPHEQPEGLESVIGLGLGRDWPPRPAELRSRSDRESAERPAAGRTS